jgi:HEAT repeat protein
MFRFLNFRFEFISFLLGFSAASLFWWLFSQAKSWYPKVKESVDLRIKASRDRNFSGIDLLLRQTTLRRAQRLHLAQAFFPLDEIIIKPYLLAPPVYLTKPDDLTISETVADQIIPYLPDSPELTAQYPVSRLTLAEALSNGSNIALIGRPGCGKTVVMADFASKIARRDREAGRFSNFVPVLLHILDLDFNGSKDIDPFEIIIGSVASQVPILSQGRIPNYLNSALRDRRLILLIDGLDELPPESFRNGVVFIETLLKAHPQIRLVVTATPGYIDGLSKLAIFPLGMLAWNDDKRKQFIRKWGSLWHRYLSPEIDKQSGIQETSQLLLDNWLENLGLILSPLEFTLMVWAAYAGDMTGLSVSGAIEAYLQRVAPAVPHSALEMLSYKIYKDELSSLDHHQIEGCIRGYSTPSSDQQTSPDVVSDLSSSSQPQLRKKDQKAAPRSQMLSILLEFNLIVEHSNEQFRFINPLFAGYLASFKLAVEIPPKIKNNCWSVYTTALSYLSTKKEFTAWIDTIVIGEPPLFQNYLYAGNWIREAHPNAEWKSGVLRQCVNLLNRDNLPMGIRARFLMPFIMSNDASSPLLFKQLLSAASPTTRRLGAIGLGAIRYSKAIDDLLGLYKDPIPEVRNTACMALAAINNPASIQTLAETLLKGDEELRKTAAECFARNPTEGYEVLKDAMTFEDILVRRAAVFGLAQIREKWSYSLLEKAAVEENQWVVRNAAGQAVENLQKPLPNIPTPLTPPSETPWLLTFASKQGSGISAGQAAVGLIIQALKSETLEDRLSSMPYLINITDEEIVTTLYEYIFKDEEGILREAALYWLWYMASCGVNLSLPQKYGIVI